MLKNMNIGGRLLTGICTVMIATLIVYTLIIVSKTSTIATEDATKLATQMAGTYGNKVKNNIEKALDASNATAAAFVAITEKKETVDRETIDNIQKAVTLSDSTFYGIQTVFAPNALDGRDAEFANTKPWYGKDGRYGPYFWRDETNTKLLAEDLTQYDPDNTRAWYKGPRDTGRPVLTEPYVGITKVPMATVSVPMKSQGKFIGIVGIDFTLGAFQQMVNGIKPMETGYAMVVSNKGYCVAHPNKSVVTKNITEALPPQAQSSLLAAIEEGKIWKQELISPLDNLPYLFVFAPIQIAGTTTPWSIGIAIPVEKITAVANEFLTLSLGLSAAAIILMLGLIILIVRSITRPINVLVNSTEAIANGNYDAAPDDSNFYGELLTLHHALKRMVEDLVKNIRTSEEKTKEAEIKTLEAEQMANKAKDALEEAQRARSEGMLHAADQLEGITERVTTASAELSERISDASSGSDIQRQRTTETATAMEEMNASVLEVAQNAGNAADSAEDARQHAETGSEIVTNVVDAISRVHAETRELEAGLNSLGERAEGIGSVMTVITDIADQTNLLALNAAIEAARAGEAGRGFAVVADEVRKLAEKTMQATKEVGEAVTAIQAGTTQNIQGMQETAQTVGSATELASQAGEALGNILQIVESTADQVRAIATASEQQSAASEEINQGTDEVNRVATETAESMDMAASSVEQLTSLAEEMNRLIEELKQG